MCIKKQLVAGKRAWLKGSTASKLMFLTAILALCVLNFSPALAQLSTADILGRVTDQTDAVIPGAKITLKNLATGVTATTKSNDSGDFLFTQLQTGHYSVTIEATGFKKVIFPDAAVSAGDRLREDGKLETGSVEETIEVTSAPPLLQTDSAAVASVVTEKSVKDLPLNGRNFVDLVTIQPGVNQGPPNAISSGTRPDDRRQSSTISANGQSDLFNNQMIDGLDNNEREQGFLGVRVPVDAIAEVKVDTNVFPAESGRDAGAVVNVITKGGGNELHGTVYEFFRNDIFDANPTSFGNNLPKSELRQNQFGGSAGGPIIKDHTFFFGNVEELRNVAGANPTLMSIPTAQEHPNGGFVDFTDNGGSKLPTAILSNAGLNYLSLFPLPNTGAPGATINNWVSTPKNSQNSLSLVGRIDQHFKNGDSLFGRYAYNNVKTLVPGSFPTVKVAGFDVQPGGANFQGPSITKAHSFQLDYIHMFGSNLVMDLKTGYTRIDIQTLPLNFGKNISDAFGVVNANTSAAPFTSGLSPVSVSGVILGDSIFLPIIDINNIYQYAGSLTYTKGAHTIKTGASMIRRQLNYFQSGYGLAVTAFVGLTGNSVQDMLLNLPIGFLRANQLNNPRYLTPEFGGYVQDDWRVNHSLTLNVGLRYDVFMATREAHNEYANFDYKNLTMILGSQDPHVGVKTSFKNFQPRFGFSQSLGKGTVVRGGFGISAYPAGMQSAISLPNPPYQYNVSCIPCFGQGFNWPTLPIPTPPSLNNLSGNLNAVASNFNVIYIQQFNLMVQKEFRNNVLTIGGIGELGRKMTIGPAINLPKPTGPYSNPYTQVRPAAPAFLTAAKLPNVGNIPEAMPGGTSNYYALQVVFARRFTKGLAFNANYTLGRGLGNAVAGSGGGGATFWYNPRYDYGNSGVDIRQRIATNFSYQLPFGQHATGAEAFLTKGWETNFIMFWQTGQPFSVSNGFSLNPGRLAQNNLPQITTDRPNLIPGLAVTTPGKGLNNWINPAAFTPQLPGTLGNERANAFHGPHMRSANFSLFKNFKVTEKVTSQFRAEVYNLSNTPNYGNPNASATIWNAGPNHDATHPICNPTNNATLTAVGVLPGDTIAPFGTAETDGTNNCSGAAKSTFGSITSTIGSPRQFQFAMKIIF